MILLQFQLESFLLGIELFVEQLQNQLLFLLPHQIKMLLVRGLVLKHPAAKNNISPRPNNFSAPPISKMVLESIEEDTANAILEGILALITPVMTSTLWSLCSNN